MADDGRLNRLRVRRQRRDHGQARTGAVRRAFVFVGNADALRPEDGPITLAEALRQPLGPAVPHRRALLEDKARELGEQVHVRFEVESGSIMSDLIAQKLGYSILPASVVSSRVQRGELAIRRIFQPDWSCTLRLWPLGGDLSSATQAVIKLVSEVDEEARKSRAGASGPRAPDHFGMAGEPRETLTARGRALRCSCAAGPRGAASACRADPGAVRLARYRTRHRWIFEVKSS